MEINPLDLKAQKFYAHKLMKSSVRIAAGIIFLLINTFSLNSQTKPTFSLGFYGGVFLPAHDFQSSPETGFKIGADLEVTFIGTYALFAAFNYNPGKKKEEPFYVYSSNPNITVTEASIGPRWYIGKGRINAIVEGGLGLYTIHQDSYTYTFNNEPYTADEYSSGGKFGLNLGAGVNYKLTKKIDLCLKGKINYISINYGESYSNIYLGIRYHYK